MARWMLNLDGGPKRVNHAAVAFGDKIYSFGGYTATEVGPQSDFIDIHVLNTFSYRWELLPTFPFECGKKPRSATISGPLPETPSTSQSTQTQRRRTRSLSTSSSSHPLAQIRSANPPLDEEEGIGLNLGEIEENVNNEAILEEENILMELINGDNEMDITQATDAFTVYQQILSDIDHNLENGSDNDDATFDMSSVYSENSQEGDDDEDMDLIEDDEERIFVHIDGIGDLDLPNNVDRDKLEKLKEHPEIPFKLYGHTVVSYKGFFYLWGGRSDAYATNLWSIVTTIGQCPARDGHSAIVWGDYMYIFGGYEEREQRFSQETYSFHFPTNTWNKLKTFGEPPQYRDFHTSCVLNGRMYVFGGRSDESGQTHTNHDLYDDKLHFLDLKSMQWNVVKPANNEQPCGRRSHTMWTFKEFVYLFGGYNSISNVHFNDLWRFDPITNTWTEQKILGQGPSPRRRQCNVMIGNRLFLFGGTMPNPRKKSSCALEDLGDLYILDFSPTLSSLCLQAVLKLGLKQQAKIVLPQILNRELHYMSTPNQLSRISFRSLMNMRG
uniref:BTB domain-containing protein n=1 Tax=Meloidogyne hapla TaxID=6305 RepID=A0A1I8C0H8_MELHA